jgi:hypothetical protein
VSGPRPICGSLRPIASVTCAPTPKRTRQLSCVAGASVGALRAA